MLFRNARKAFLKQIDIAAIEAATRDSERKTTGEIRVSVFPRIPGSLEVAAEKVARRLKMTDTKDRNGVLILVVPAKRRFVIWGDKTIHEKLGQEFWTRTAEAVSERFRKEDFTGGLVHGIETVGRELAAHFPAGPGEHQDQLPDSIDAPDGGLKT
jgi:uncharacterized membrane protein